MSSVLDKIRALDEQKAQLLSGAKQEALDKANAAIGELRELGFTYRLVQSDQSTRAAPRTGRARRGSIRDGVLKTVKAFPKINRADILEKTGVKGDKTGEQSVSNALAALKKAGVITLTNGAYTIS